MNIEQKTITSVEVAEMVGKDHNKLLRDIRSYIEQLGLSKIGHTDFFIESTYFNGQNKELPCYNVTKKGCEFIGNKLTGIKGTEFTAKYINKFHDMENKLQSPASYLEILKNATLEVSQKVDAVDKDLQQFKLDMPILGIEESRITGTVRRKGVNCLGGKESAAYQNKSLRSKVYSDIYGQLKREFGVGSYKAIKRSQADMAVEVVNDYKLPYDLQQQIDAENNQIKFGKEEIA